MHYGVSSNMNSVEILNKFKGHVKSCGFEVRQILDLRYKRAFQRLFSVVAYDFWFISDQGIGRLEIDYNGNVQFFEHYATSGFMTPLWIAYPTYSSVTIGWRMGPGERYKHIWIDWFLVLSESDRQRYMILYPEPKDERGWEGYYSNFLS